MNVYLLLLEGQGDLTVTVLDEETFNWITSDDLGQKPEDEDESSWEDQLVPASQVEKMKASAKAHLERFGGNYAYHPLRITIGSYDNDRALAAKSAEGYEDVYYTIKDALKAIKSRGDEMVDEYHGCIY